MLFVAEHYPCYPSLPYVLYIILKHTVCLCVWGTKANFETHVPHDKITLNYCLYLKDNNIFWKNSNILHIHVFLFLISLNKTIYQCEKVICSIWQTCLVHFSLRHEVCSTVMIPKKIQQITLIQKRKIL